MAAKQIQSLNLDFIQTADPQPAAYLEQGQGIPLLMLHGFMGSGTCWLPLMAQLQAQVPSQIHCVALDLLGFGDSAQPAIRYDIAKEVEFVQQFIQAQNLEPCYLMGHSLGGWVAAAYALAYPNRVKGLILLAPAGIRDDSFAGRYDHLRPILWQTPLIDWVLNGIKPFSNWLGQKEALEKIAWMRGELNQQPAARSFLVDRIRPEDAIDTVEKEIHRLQTATLVITGDRDDTIPLWHSETYASEIPNAQLVILLDATHSLPQDYAAELAVHILPFLMARSRNY
jgi:pimeloyl-ACP methyl ester carboxylesterase